ncbi:hypothetical protein FNH05_25390, partial [Amycolatopsis rhizosphaerae]
HQPNAAQNDYQDNCVIAVSDFLYALAGWDTSATSSQAPDAQGRNTLEALWHEVGGVWLAHNNYSEAVETLSGRENTAAALATVSTGINGQTIRHVTAVVVNNDTGVPIFIDPQNGHATQLPENPQAIYLLPIDLTTLRPGATLYQPSDALDELPQTERTAIYRGGLGDAAGPSQAAWDWSGEPASTVASAAPDTWAALTTAERHALEGLVRTTDVRTAIAVLDDIVRGLATGTEWLAVTDLLSALGRAGRRAEVESALTAFLHRGPAAGEMGMSAVDARMAAPVSAWRLRDELVRFPTTSSPVSAVPTVIPPGDLRRAEPLISQALRGDAAASAEARTQLAKLLAERSVATDPAAVVGYLSTQLDEPQLADYGITGLRNLRVRVPVHGEQGDLVGVVDVVGELPSGRQVWFAVARLDDFPGGKKELSAQVERLRALPSADALRYLVVVSPNDNGEAVRPFAGRLVSQAGLDGVFQFNTPMLGSEAKRPFTVLAAEHRPALHPAEVAPALWEALTRAEREVLTTLSTVAGASTAVLVLADVVRGFLPETSNRMDTVVAALATLTDQDRRTSVAVALREVVLHGSGASVDWRLNSTVKAWELRSELLGEPDPALLLQLPSVVPPIDLPRARPLLLDSLPSQAERTEHTDQAKRVQARRELAELLAKLSVEIDPAVVIAHLLTHADAERLADYGLTGLREVKVRAAVRDERGELRGIADVAGELPGGRPLWLTTLPLNGFVLSPELMESCLERLRALPSGDARYLVVYRAENAEGATAFAERMMREAGLDGVLWLRPESDSEPAEPTQSLRVLAGGRRTPPLVADVAPALWDALVPAERDALSELSARADARTATLVLADVVRALVADSTGTMVTDVPESLSNLTRLALRGAVTQELAYLLQRPDGRTPRSSTSWPLSRAVEAWNVYDQLIRRPDQPPPLGTVRRIAPGFDEVWFDGGIAGEYREQLLSLLYAESIEADPAAVVANWMSLDKRNELDEYTVRMPVHGQRKELLGIVDVVADMQHGPATWVTVVHLDDFSASTLGEATVHTGRQLALPSEANRAVVITSGRGLLDRTLSDLERRRLWDFTGALLRQGADSVVLLCTDPAEAEESLTPVILTDWQSDPGLAAGGAARLKKLLPDALHDVWEALEDHERALLRDLYAAAGPAAVNVLEDVVIGVARRAEMPRPGGSAMRGLDDLINGFAPRVGIPLPADADTVAALKALDDFAPHRRGSIARWLAPLRQQPVRRYFPRTTKSEGVLPLDSDLSSRSRAIKAWENARSLRTDNVIERSEFNKNPFLNTKEIQTRPIIAQPGHVRVVSGQDYLKALALDTDRLALLAFELRSQTSIVDKLEQTELKGVTLVEMRAPKHNEKGRLQGFADLEGVLHNDVSVRFAVSHVPSADDPTRERVTAHAREQRALAKKDGLNYLFFHLDHDTADLAEIQAFGADLMAELDFDGVLYCQAGEDNLIDRLWTVRRDPGSALRNLRLVTRLTDDMWRVRRDGSDTRIRSLLTRGLPDHVETWVPVQGRDDLPGIVEILKHLGDTSEVWVATVSLDDFSPEGRRDAAEQAELLLAVPAGGASRHVVIDGPADLSNHAWTEGERAWLWDFTGSLARRGADSVLYQYTDSTEPWAGPSWVVLKARLRPAVLPAGDDVRLATLLPDALHDAWAVSNPAERAAVRELCAAAGPEAGNLLRDLVTAIAAEEVKVHPADADTAAILESLGNDRPGSPRALVAERLVGLLHRDAASSPSSDVVRGVLPVERVRSQSRAAWAWELHLKRAEEENTPAREETKRNRFTLRRDPAAKYREEQKKNDRERVAGEPARLREMSLDVDRLVLLAHGLRRLDDPDRWRGTDLEDIVFQGFRLPEYDARGDLLGLVDLRASAARQVDFSVSHLSSVDEATREQVLAHARKQRALVPRENRSYLLFHVDADTNLDEVRAFAAEVMAQLDFDGVLYCQAGENSLVEQLSVDNGPAAHPGGPHGNHGDVESLNLDEINARYSERTPSGISYHAGDPEMGDLPHRVKPDPQGRYTVDVDVTRDGQARIGDRLYTPDEFADILCGSGDYDGRPIRLIGCDASSNGFASWLSRELDTEVVASTKRAWTDSHGHVFSTDFEIGPDGRMRPRIPPNGEWHTHRPDGSSRRSGNDGFAPESRQGEPQDVDVDSARHRGDGDESGDWRDRPGPNGRPHSENITDPKYIEENYYRRVNANGTVELRRRPSVMNANPPHPELYLVDGEPAFKKDRPPAESLGFDESRSDSFPPEHVPGGHADTRNWRERDYHDIEAKIADREAKKKVYDDTPPDSDGWVDAHNAKNNASEVLGEEASNHAIRDRVYRQFREAFPHEEFDFRPHPDATPGDQRFQLVDADGTVRAEITPHHPTDGSKPGNTNFDQIWEVDYKNGGEPHYIVHEAKGPGGKPSERYLPLEGRTVKQGHPDYFDDTLKHMRRGSRELANALERAKLDGRLDYVEVRARVDESVTPHVNLGYDYKPYNGYGYQSPLSNAENAKPEE